ncbi:MAG: sigma-70 family RNA polymerase sigma factor [Clostridia bacterium]|nr:sigma-70 family RNA polymerase sigma factor [Clostridia bacterium]MBO5316756.1 sigma-70 family RNA polymerase sigma factor [Clostridia bacterium]MBR3805565.1 sigma-70 family RNA polymerase sigma factor [Clostridia bacterium]
MIKTEKKHPYDKNLDLLQAFRAGDKESGEELAKLNMPLVYSIAGRFAGRGADMSDLVECGSLGLVKAMRTFDFSHGCAFSTYAVPLIFGEIRRFLRDDGIIKVSREEKRLAGILNAERERRLSSGEEADIASVARAVGISPQDAASAIFSSVPPRSLDERAFDDDDTATLGSMICDEDAETRDFNKFALRLAIEKLSPERKKLIILRYFRDLSQSETAKILGLSQVKVSREEKKIMEILKRDMV